MSDNYIGKDGRGNSGLPHRRLLLTGASGGIGRAVARRFLQDGYDMALICHRNREACAALEAEAEDRGRWLAVYSADLSDSGSAETCLQQALADFGHFDCLICSAGVSERRLLRDMRTDEAESLLRLNYGSVLTAARLLSPAMVRRGWGRILNIASIWGLRGAAMEAHYAASKAALIALSKSLARELGPSGITVNAVCPGLIETAMNHRDLRAEEIQAFADDLPLGRAGKAEEVAALLAFLASDQAAYITGQAIAVDGGATA